MKFTDLFIKRPVLAMVVSLLILFGINSVYKMQIRQFPRMDNTVITVTTSYPGADASLIAALLPALLKVRLLVLRV